MADHSIFELNIEGAKHRDGRLLEFLCSCPTKPEAEELVKGLGDGFYYILPCYEVKDKEVRDRG